MLLWGFPDLAEKLSNNGVRSKSERILKAEPAKA
jgi:hypothetical protein